ncbi:MULTISPECIES: DUF6199 family natural product biosynthesis protein [unclassified Streptomyces]|uniref:DUF6199 family natural product biosynthesis protein n=1 Tax=unclassified Streptomyces TaxID=2593676 RepID=UPI001011712E|nr:DUF6199 family natural product biosynthesis protein [Streptomyces sp. GZWMJZ-114]
MTPHHGLWLAEAHTPSPFFFVVLAIIFALSVTQLVSPRLFWRLNRPFQRPFVKDYDATEPSTKGYAVMRLTAGIVAAACLVFLVTALR